MSWSHEQEHGARFIAVGGALITTALILYGAVIFSPVALLALLALPAPPLFIFVAVRPSVYTHHRAVRAYLWAALGLVVAACAVEAVRLTPWDG